MINVIGSPYLYTFFSTRFCLMLTFCITRFFFFNGKVRNFIIGRRNYITTNTSSIIYLFLYKIEFFYNLIKCICVKFFLKNLNFDPCSSHFTPHRYLYLWSNHRVKGIPIHLQLKQKKTKMINPLTNWNPVQLLCTMQLHLFINFFTFIIF